jgi:phosphatidylglycerophosphate synthase
MGTVTALPARTARDALARSALITLLAVGLGVILVAWVTGRQLQFSSAYLTKSLLIFAVGALLVRAYLPAHHPFPDFGAANTVTLVRAALVALLAALVGEHAAVAPLAATVITMDVIVLDGVDGWLARRTRMSSRFGARFDMETDAVLVAVLAVLVWQFGKAGVWVLLSGAMRYLFAAAGAIVPLLRRPLPSGYRGKTIAVIQMLALVVALAPWSSTNVAVRVAAAGLGCLTLSFLLDIVWLVRHAR